MNLQGQSTEVAHHFFDLWQDSLESQLDKMLADHRPCHYAVQNGSGQVDWVPKHTPCWFEAKSGKLIIDTANDSRWLPSMRNGPAKLMQVHMTSLMGMEEPTLAVPGLSFPRRQTWQKLPVLEIDLGDVPRADCCPLSRVRIYTEELRALRTAVQLMVKRAEEKSAAQPLLQPASSAMEPIQEGGSEADGSGPDGSASSPAEEATPDSAQARAALPQAPEPHAPAEEGHEEGRSASPQRSCGCFGFGSRRPSSAKPSNEAADQGPLQIPEEEPPSTPRVSEKASANRGTTDLGEGSVLEDAASPGANEDDSAMLFYHETGLPDTQLTDHQPSHNGNVSKHRERERVSQDDSAMAYGAPQDNSSGDSAVHPLPTDPSAGATRPSARPLESHDCPAPYSATVGATSSAEIVPFLEAAVRQKRATGASLPALLMSTAQAVGLGGSHGFSHSMPDGLDTLLHGHPEDSDASESLFLDTARGPRGGYYDAPRGGQQAAQLNGHMSLPVSSHVWAAARMVAESRAACKEVWAPGYDHSPGLSDSEDPPDRVSRMPTVATPKAALSPAIEEPTEQTRQGSAVPKIPSLLHGHPFQPPAAALKLQDAPERDPESPAEEVPVGPTLLAQPSVEFVTAAMSNLGSLDVFGQGMGSQSSMLPCESRKLAHLVLRANDVPEKSRHQSATPGDILQMRQALGRFPESILSAPPSGQATQPLLAAQPAQYGPKVPMQPALSLVDWTDVPAPVLEPPLADQEAFTEPAKQRQPQSPRPEDAGTYSNSDVEIDSPFASNSLPREGQPHVFRRINKYAGTSDIIYEDMNNPFDKFRGPPRARRNRTGGKRSSSGSKGSSSSRSKSPAAAASPAREPDVAGSPASCLSLSASASGTPAQSADASPTPSPAREGGMALHPAAAHEDERSSGDTLTPDISTDDSESAEGVHQATSLQNEAQSGALQPSAAAAAAAHKWQTGHEHAVTPVPQPPSHPGVAETAKGPALQGATTVHSITQPDNQPVGPPLSAETETAQCSQPEQAVDVPTPTLTAAHQNSKSEPLPADEYPAGESSKLQAAVVMEHALQAERPSYLIEGDTYYDAVPVASAGPLASAAASSAVPEQASLPMQSAPSRAGSVQEASLRAGGQHRGASPERESPASNIISSAADNLGQLMGLAKHGKMQKSNGDAGSMQSTDAEQHVAVTLGVRRPKAVGMVAAAIAALGLSSPARQAPEEPVKVRITPLKEALPRSKAALDPDQMDATWYSSLLMSSATPARGSRQRPAVSTFGARAAEQRVDAEEAPDRAAVAAARLTGAGRGPKECLSHGSAPAQEAKAFLAGQDDPAAGRSDVPTTPNVHHVRAAAAAAGRGAELPEEVATPGLTAAVAPAAGPQQDDMPPSAQAAADVALLPEAGLSPAGLPRQDLPETVSPSKASRINTMPDGPSTAATSLEAPAQNAHPSLDTSPPTDALPSASASAWRLSQEQPDQAAAKITPANRARGAAMILKERIEGFQQRSEAAAPAERTRSAMLPSPQKPWWERPDQAPAATSLGGGAMLARCASDAAQQALRNRALVSELKQHLQTSGPRPSAGPTALKRKPSSQLPVEAMNLPHDRGLLYKPELHSVADRVRYIERAHSRNVPPLSALTTQSSISHLPAICQPAALQEAA